MTLNLDVATELFHEVDIDGECIFQHMPRRAIVDFGSLLDTSGEMEAVVSYEIHSHEKLAQT